MGRKYNVYSPMDENDIEQLVSTAYNPACLRTFYHYVNHLHNQGNIVKIDPYSEWDHDRVIKYHVYSSKNKFNLGYEDLPDCFGFIHDRARNIWTWKGTDDQDLEFAVILFGKN